MDALQFAYWLQGFTELHGEPPTPEQWKSIKEHLALVFTKVTPPVLPPGSIHAPKIHPHGIGGLNEPILKPLVATC